MNLSQLRMVKAVAENGSIVKAADVLNCVPSNITNRIKSLEEDLGVTLFVRKGRGLVITPSGEILLGYANQILAFCEEARRALSPSSEPSGILRIGAIESAATGRLPTVLAKFHRDYPGVRMQFNTGTWQKLVSDIAELKLDGAIIATKSDHPDISYEDIYSEPLVIIASPSAGEISNPQDLKGKNIFMWPQGCPYRQSLERWLSEHQHLADIISIASYGTILGCVSSGAGISLVPFGIFEQFKSIGDINGYTFRELPPVQNYFIKSRAMNLHHARDAFAALLHQECKDI